MAELEAADTTELAALRAHLLLLASAAGALSTAQAQEPAAGDEDLITVTGRRVSQASEAIGEDKISNVVAVTREALLSAPSGISGLKMLEQLPELRMIGDLEGDRFANRIDMDAAFARGGATSGCLPLERTRLTGGSSRRHSLSSSKSKDVTFEGTRG